MTFKNKNALFCALDMKTIDQAIALTKCIYDYIDGIKVGMEAFYSMGIEGYLRLQDLNIPIFLDLKLHDITKTVKSAIANAENTYQYYIDNLYVKEAFVGKSIVMKRFRPRAVSYTHLTLPTNREV